eukprot:s1342_g3.t1
MDVHACTDGWMDGWTGGWVDVRRKRSAEPRELEVPDPGTCSAEEEEERDDYDDIDIASDIGVEEDAPVHPVASKWGAAPVPSGRSTLFGGLPPNHPGLHGVLALQSSIQATGWPLTLKTTLRKREALLGLKARANEKAQEAPELESLLQRLSAALVAAAQSRPCPAESIAGFGATSPRWRQLGFQSCDPRSDLRTGILALDCLVHMAERYPLATSQMVREAQSDGIDYPFAVASINITQHLARYLQLVKDGLGCSGMQSASPRVVHRFARLLASSRQRIESKEPAIEPFCELHAAVMARLHSNWRARKQEDPSITVMHFGPIMEETLAAACAFCKQAPMETASEFRGLASVSQEASAPPRAAGEEESEDFAKLADSVQQTVQKFSETASIFGTYLHGV